MLRRTLVPLLLLASAGTLAALDPNRTLTQYVHRIWTVQQGLPGGTIFSISQTRDGFLWLGTQTGMVRFDGVRFTAAESLYKGIPENLWIRTAFEDSGGALWAGTNEAGILRFQNGDVARYSTKEGLPSDLIFCLIPGGGSDLWACTPNGLAHLVDGKIEVYHTRPSPESTQGPGPDAVFSACRAPDGKLWVGGDRPMVLRQNGSGFEALPLRSIPSDASVRAVSCSGDSVWVGTTAGLVRVQGSSQRLFTVKDGLVDDGVLSLKESRDGSLWIGTRSGFSRLRNGEFESFRPQDGLSQSSVSSIYEDREGSLWVGTKHGLNQFVEGRAIPYTVNEGLPSNDAGPLLQDSKGRIWVGTLDAGLAPFDGRRFRSIRASQGLASDTILALAENQDGGVWVGTDRGLNLLNDGRITAAFGMDSGLPSSEIRCLYRDPEGVLWVGTSAGLARYKDGRFVIPEGAARDPILAIAGDRQGRPLYSTEHGLFRVDGSALQEIAPNGAALRGVDAIYRDQDGLIWLGSNSGGSGLRLLQESGGQAKITVFLVREGLFDNEVYGIVPDDQGRLWMACSKGIFSVLRSDLLRFAAGEVKKISSTPYSPTDALRVIECKPGVQPGVWKMSDGRLWFSTIRGLIVLDPARLQRNVPPPQVVIEEVLVNGNSERPDAIGRLAPGKKNLEFNYTGLSFLAPTRITFRYVLEGYDPTWIEAGTRREAYYTNLPPGTFHFRVAACNSDGVCNEAGSVVEFTLAPHYYQRIWFWPSVALVLALVGWLTYRLHIRRLRQGYDLIVAERSRIARELHDTLIQGFSGITMAMQALAGRLRSAEERNTLDDIIHDAANCLRETRRSVAGLRGAREPESGLAASIGQAARQITETKDVRLKLKLDKGPQGLPPEFEYNLLRIATEAVSNSVKHSGARTIEVTLKSSPEAVRLVVSDDGAGFEPDDHGHLKPGHYGLIGMKERAAQIGAEFEFDSAPGRGTTVVVAAPLGRSTVLETVK